MIEKNDGSVVVDMPEEETKDQVEVIDEPIGQATVEQIASQDGEESDQEDEINKVREQRRLANKERRERQKNARDSDKMRIAMQERTIYDLKERLVKLENNHDSMRLARLDSSINHQEDLINAIREKIATTENRAEHTDLIDRLADEKLKLRELYYQKDQSVKSANKPKSTVNNHPNMQKLAREWMNRTPWFDLDGKGVDTRIATVIDEELSAEGWNPATEEYWDELDARLAERLPHRYNEKKRSSPPVGSSRNVNSPVNTNGLAANQFYISKERKQALMDAGVWDDPTERNKYIKRYMKYDRENRNDA